MYQLCGENEYKMEEGASQNGCNKEDHLYNPGGYADLNSLFLNQYINLLSNRYLLTFYSSPKVCSGGTTY